IASNRQARLETQWTSAAQDKGAASLAFVNEVDDEDGPPLPSNFQYLEDRYAYSKGYFHPDQAFFVSCDCFPTCKLRSLCSCQEGLVSSKYPHGIDIIECNKVCIFTYVKHLSDICGLAPKFCSCNKTCINRVSQQPRDVPLEIFKTKGRGWGVRTVEALPAGKLVGRYTGLREEADKPGCHHDFMFDLDGHETSSSTDEDEESYTVDAYKKGNWTRFVNHSCVPNMRVHNVVCESLPEKNTPYIVFVTSKHIPPYSELTIDYDPKATMSLKQIARSSPDSSQCLCGEVGCRKWVAVHF
ncbi:hypothetical protein BC834DRAFT_828379, partial [Gloeopeniophorella convolvens]